MEETGAEGETDRSTAGASFGFLRLRQKPTR